VRREALATKLATVVEAFDAWTPSIDDPDWGHAEALTALAATVLDSGQVRTARDLIERALLLAPDYRVAVELRIALQGARGGSRAL
jgi:Tfp pilus assembly protein PilF